MAFSKLIDFYSTTSMYGSPLLPEKQQQKQKCKNVGDDKINNLLTVNQN